MDYLASSLIFILSGGQLNMENYYNNELYHYGVLGMKWGVRKDDNTSKSRRKKRSRSSGKGFRPIKKYKAYRQKQKSKKRALKQNLNNISSMSNKEIDDRIVRLEKEIKLRDLEYKRSAESRTGRAVESVLADAGEIAVKDVVAGSMTYVGAKASSAVLGSGVSDYIPKKGRKK